MTSSDLHEALGIINHFAQTFWIIPYLSETPSGLPHPHPGFSRTVSGSLFSPFPAWQNLFVKEVLPSTDTAIYLSSYLFVSLPNFLTPLHPSSCFFILQPTIHPSTLPLICSIHISTYLPKHPPTRLLIHLTIHPSIPYPLIHLSIQQPILPSTDSLTDVYFSTHPSVPHLPSPPRHPPSISLPTHPLIYLYPHTHPPILAHLPTHHP